jgi:hypothetical protein
VCGSVNAIYTVLFYHRASNSYVRTGTDCAEKLGYGDGEAFRAQCLDARLARAGKKKAQALLIERGMERAWEIYLAGSGGKREEGTVVDIVAKLVKYGSASDAQYAFVSKLLSAIEERPAREAKFAAEREAASPAPTGRVKICGTIVSVKTYDDECYGLMTKITVKTTDGWCAFGSLPSSLRYIEDLRGKTVTLTATVTPSRDDPKFGFFKRPAKALCAGD